MGHEHLLMHDPVIHIPLVIFPPEQTERIDIYSRTNAVDIFPTLHHITGQNIPDWSEGELLPPFGSAEKISERSVFALNPRDNSPLSKQTEGVYVIFKDKYKLIYYFGLDEIKGNDPYFELYDIKNDPEELNNLYTSKKSIAEDLLQELLTKMEVADVPYN